LYFLDIIPMVALLDFTWSRT